MGDPLSIAGSIAGLVSLGDVVFRKIYHYVCSVKRAEREILALRDEVAGLTGILHHLRLVAQKLERIASSMGSAVWSTSTPVSQHC
ncbi:hypothetical protein M011DRAFT_467515, partial [Sporormia fimetaria CBS 119925]